MYLITRSGNKPKTTDHAWLRSTCLRHLRGRFHQTLCAKQKDAGAQCLAKNLQFNFINNIYASYVSRNSPNWCAVCQTPFATKSVEFCKQRSLSKKSDKNLAKNLGKNAARIWWWNRPLVCCELPRENLTRWRDVCNRKAVDRHPHCINIYGSL